MTNTGEAVSSTKNENSASTKKSDGSQHFLRAARAGNLNKVIDLLAISGVDIHSSNANGLNALHLASKEGHVDVVQQLLSHGADVNRATRKGNTALHIASLAGQLEVVRLLISRGASVNIQAQNGFTPLYMAAQENHMEVLKLLLAHNANPGLTTDDGFTPLAVALQQGHDRIVALLLEHDSRGRICLPALHIAAKKDDVKAANLLLNSDVNINYQSGSGFTPLHIAAHYGNVNMTELLISRGADINFQAKNNITPLHVACKWGNHGVAERLIMAGVELDCRTRDGLTPLHCAARSGHDTVVQLLLTAGANYAVKSKSGLNALHMAAQGDHVDSAQRLIQRGLAVDDTTVDFLTALHVAAHCGNSQVAGLLVDRGCDANARALNGFTPLHVACQKNRSKVVELLLKHPCHIEATTETGLTPLHVACFMGHLNIVVLLLQHGANPNAPTVRSETALHLATRAGHYDVVRLLLRNGAQVDARARGHQTSLHVAARMGHLDLVTLLLEHSANAQATTKDTYTPLHLAAKANHVEVCRLLLKAGAQVEATTRSNFTPLHLAAKHSKLDAARLLISSGANVSAAGRNGLTPLHLATHYGCLSLVKELLLHKADPRAQAKNGFTPLHIASVKRFLEIAELLLNAEEDNVNAYCNSESRNGFTALHLASQDGSIDTTSLLLKAGANVNAKAKNGLSPMHLAAQEDSVKAAELLHAAGSELDARTKAGYTPLHTACHFGQANMVRFLLGKGADVNAQTCLGSNALHLAAQQGHSKVIYMLLESGANANMRNQMGWTPAHVARRQHYLNIFEVLRQVTTCVESWEEEDRLLLQEGQPSTDAHGLPHGDQTGSPGGGRMTATTPGGTRLLLEQPDVMGDHPVTDTEEECIEPDYTVIPASPLFTRAQLGGTVPRPISLETNKQQVRGRHQTSRNGLDKLDSVSGEDSIHETIPTDHVRSDTWLSVMASQTFSDVHGADMNGIVDWDFIPDNVPVSRKPITSGFLVSFLVDARGGSMRGSRHPGLRILVPPNAASAPTRITCRVLRSERAANPPPLNDSEGLACRIVELGPYPCTFNSPVLLELPHFASLRGRQRELVVLRSDNGKNWQEHSLEATDQAVKSALGQSFVDENLETSEELREKRIVRILTNNFPQYLAVVSRLRQEAALIGSDGGVLSSSVVPQVQAVFPEGALQKRIRVGLQAHPISDDLVASLFGSRVAVSPIVTLEPRRRKFHKPITLTIPLPKVAYRAMQGNDSTYLNTQNAPSLRVLCSITGGTLPAQWEDLTGSTPLSKVKDCVAFTTTVSARFWLVYCPAVHEATETATRLYHEASLVPYMCKFAVFSKRQNNDEALLRCFCISDDKVDKTLECQEGFQLCATSQEIEILHDQYAWLSAVGNLLPLTRSGEQLRLHFTAFRENRLAFPVRVKDMQQPHVGKLAFVREPRPSTVTPGSSTPADVRHASAPLSPPICTLEVDLAGDNMLLQMQEAKHSAASAAGASEAPDTSAAAPSSFSSISCVYPAVRATDADLGCADTPVNGAPPSSEWPSVYAHDVIARTELDLLHVASEVGADWRLLVPHLLPNSRLDSHCSVDQLVTWINDKESVWQEQHHRAEGSIGGGLGGLRAHELRSESDRALAVLLAWREERGELATGNELDRALRAIGRMDVVKSCMLGIQYVVEEAEQLEATRRIDGVPANQEVAEEEQEPATTSLVATDVLESGMAEPSLQWTSLGLSETAPSQSLVAGDASEAVGAEKPVETPKGEGDVEGECEDEGEDEVEQQWVPNAEERSPAKSTSQQGGDPLLMEVVEGGGREEAGGNPREEIDLVRESESMTASLDERTEQAVEQAVESSVATAVGAADQEPLEVETEHRSAEELNIVDEPMQPDQLELLKDAHHSGSACASDVEVEFDRGIPIRSEQEEEEEAQAPVDQSAVATVVLPVKGEDDSHVDSEGIATAHHGVQPVPRD